MRFHSPDFPQPAAPLNVSFPVLNCLAWQAPYKSNGYEDVATAFIACRGRHSAGIGVSVVAEWSQTLPAGATVLDLGCGTGVPISQVLIERDFKVYGVDASPTIVAAFRVRFPDVPIECVTVEDSQFFTRTFDAVIAWGLLFLLEPEVQRRLIKKIAGVLRSGGRLLFTAPKQSGSWPDIMTGRPQFSLGYDEYKKKMEAEGLLLIGTRTDEGENHYYLAQKL